jgi:hypothetical protein
VRSSCSGLPDKRIAASLCALALSLAAGAHADDVHERQLDQQLQELRRQVDAQVRRIEQLERSQMRSSGPTTQIWTEKATAPAGASPWLVASNWERVHAGMSAEQVTTILGAPNSERPGDGGTTALLYAFEVQEGVFLAGRVEMRDGKVTAVQKPELR